VSAGFTVPGRGLTRAEFFAGKSLRRRDGTPAVTVHTDAMDVFRDGGNLVPLGRTRRRSQWVLRANSGTVESVAGSMTHRTTRACMIGFIEAARKEERKAEVQVRGSRDTRYRSQSGILTVWRRKYID
jgi:hypothetical protein